MHPQVLIFEDNRHFRESISELVDATGRYTVCGAYPDCSQVLDVVRRHRPDIIFMDIQMPGISGIQAIGLIRKEFPDMRIIVQTVFNNEDYIFAAICAGASGYILKNSSLERYEEALDEVMTSGSPLSPSIATKVLSMFKAQVKPQQKATGDDLSEREREVLLHMTRGLSYKMIAAACHISVDTVRFHVKNIYQKLHVNSMTEAVIKAMQEKLV